MNKFLINSSLCLLLFASCATSCAKYRAEPLEKPHVEGVSNSYQKNGLTLMVKAFNQADCMTYLDRDVLAKGFQPIQITVQNDSKHGFWISKDAIDLTLASTNEVAKLVETSTVGRATGYGVAAVFIFPFVIPAIVDGVKSSKANKQLNLDFAQKSINEHLILPGEKFTGLVFAPIASYQDSFSISLSDRDTRDVVKFDVRAPR